MENKKGKIIVVLISMVVLIRLVLLIPAWTYPDRFLQIDSLQYLSLAENLISQGHYQSPNIPELDLMRPPGYPLFMIPGLLLGAGSTRWISVYQVVLSFLTAAILYKLGRDMNQTRMGLLAAILYLINPNAIFWSMVLLTETLAGFFLVLAIYSLFRFYRSRSPWWLFITSLSLGLGALTRPILNPIAYLWILFAILLIFKRPLLSRVNLQPAILIVVGYLLVVFPWQMRNQVAYGVFSISSVGGSTIEDWMVAKVVADIHGISRSEAVALINQQPDPIAYSLQVIRENPTTFAKEQVRGILRTILGSEYVTWAQVWGGQQVQSTGILSILLGGDGSSSLARILQSSLGNPWFLAGLFALAFDVFLYGACILGVVRLWHFRENRELLLLGILLVLTIAYLEITPFAAGESRFRATADPLLSLLAGGAWVVNTHQVEDKAGSFEPVSQKSE